MWLDVILPELPLGATASVSENDADSAYSGQLSVLDQQLQKLYDAAPPHTRFYVIMQGDLKAVKHLSSLKTR